MKISTTITKKFFEMKMRELKNCGYFFEFKEDKPFWEKRLKEFMHCQGFAPVSCDIVFLVGSEPHRFKAVEVLKICSLYVPEEYSPAITTEQAYAIKCVKLSDMEAAQVIATNLEKAGFKANIQNMAADIHWLREKGLVEE